MVYLIICGPAAYLGIFIGGGEGNETVNHKHSGDKYSKILFTV